MDKQSIISDKFINFSPKGTDKLSAITEMSNLLELYGRINDKDAYIAGVLERENISTTDTGIGVAIPHGKGGFVETTSIAIFRYSDGLLWDDDPVKAVFLLAVDDDSEGNAHLEVIATVSTMLMDDDFLHVLFNAVSEKQLFDEIMKRMEKEE